MRLPVPVYDGRESRVFAQDERTTRDVQAAVRPGPGTPEHFGMTFAKGDSLVRCVNRALHTLKSTGKLQSITAEWLSKKTNVGEVPVFSNS